MATEFLSISSPNSDVNPFFLPSFFLFSHSSFFSPPQIQSMNSRLVPVNGSSPAAAGGHHRQKLDLIRSSLRPFEQQQKWREEEDEEHIPEEEADEEEDEDRKAGMMRALVEAGYDQESAFYALKLVNFRSAQDAELVLRSIKKNLMKQHQVNSAGGGIPLLDSSPQHQPHSIDGVAPWPAERLAPAKSLPISGPQQQNNKLPSAKPNPVKVASRLSPPSQGYLFKQSQSFGPVDFPQSSRPPPMSTVIRIERNQSERLERKAAIDPPPRQPPQTAQLPRKVQQRELRSPAASRLHPTISLPACAPSASCSTSPTAALAMASPRPVQRIFIDPEEEEDGEALLDLQPPPNYGQYMDQMNRKMDGRLPAFSPSAISSSSPSPGPANPVASANRSVSPLPESVAKRLKAGSYERVVKPCRAPMFRFFMEQHIEKLSQQNQERNKRARQLSHEMEAAGLADNVKENMLRLLRQKESKYLRMRRQKMNRTMFELIRHIGIGAFGKVTLVRKRDTDQVYAMKTLVKADVIQKQQAAHVKAERDILSEANSAWIVKLFFSFQDAQNLYFIMEYVPGGDMMQLLINMGIFPESLARFYTAELCLAVEYVHSLGFIHRDIKPDNILIDRGGHIKLTDFGLCTGLRWTHDKRHYVVYDAEQQNGIAHLREDSFSLPAGLERRVKLLEMRHHRRDRAHSVVGTGNYMAPEVIQRVGHTQLCDWWSVGVILYEMVYGRPPFMSQRDDPAETQYMIVHWRRFLDLNNPMGARLSRNCVNCISRLCCDQEMRLGHRQGAKDIKEHAWFRGIDFANLRNSTPEYVPRVRHPEDTSNFDTFEVRSDELAANGTGAGSSNRAMGSGGPAGGAPNFFDFTFRHFFSEGMGPPTTRGQQPRPSLAPLMETAEPSGSKSVANASTTTTNVPAAPGSKVPPSPIRPKLPSKAALYSPPSARTVLQIGQFRPLQTKLDEEEAEESQC